MATNWDLYEGRLSINGSTKRERDVNELKSTLSKKLPDTISCKSVLINNIQRSLVIIKAGYDYLAVHSLPDETITSGDYVTYNSKTFIVTKTDVDETYISGRMQECNYLLKWQASDGTILSYPCITSSKKLGEEEGKVITLGANQKSVTLPYNQTTVWCRLEKRFFIDRNTVNPIPYKVVGFDTTSHNGLIELILDQDVVQNDDRIDLGVCDYKEPSPIPDPVNPDVPQVVVTITSDVVDNSVKLGLTYNFTATFTNQLGEVITSTQPKYTINNKYDGLVTLEDNGDKTAKVTVNLNALNLVGKQFMLTCIDIYSGFSSSIALTIVGKW